MRDSLCNRTWIFCLRISEGKWRHCVESSLWNVWTPVQWSLARVSPHAASAFSYSFSITSGFRVSITSGFRRAAPCRRERASVSDSRPQVLRLASLCHDVTASWTLQCVESKRVSPPRPSATASRLLPAFASRLLPAFAAPRRREPLPSASRLRARCLSFYQTVRSRPRVSLSIYLSIYARLVAQAERGGRVRVVRGQGRREAELEQHAPLPHEECVGELR